MRTHLTLLPALALALAACSPGSEEAPTPEAEAPLEPAAPPEPDWTEVLREALTVSAPPSNSEIIDALLGNVEAPTDENFTQLPAPLASRDGLYVRTDTADALLRMHAAAAADGVELVVISAFRSARDQTRIWNNKWEGTTLVEGGALPETVPDERERARKILEYSSMPGTSRHHWGTDIDLNSLYNEWFDTPEGAAVYDWLVRNAGEFGFCQVYTAKGPTRPNGYEMEKWHWSYMPLASKFLAAYPRTVGYSELTGFSGAEQSAAIDVVDNYVGGIAPACSTNWPAAPTNATQSPVPPAPH